MYKLSYSLQPLLVFVLLGCLISLGLPGKAQSIVPLRTVSLAEGLSNPNVNAIYQDTYGFMRIGTSEGLNGYDGNSCKVYEYNPGDPFSLGANSVNSFYEDRTGRFWVSTRGGGLCLYDPDADGFTCYQHDPNDPQSLADNYISGL